MAKGAKTKKEKKTKSAKKDKDRPKGYISCYFVYHQERRNSLRKRKARTRRRIL